MPRDFSASLVSFWCGPREADAPSLTFDPAQRVAAGKAFAVVCTGSKLQSEFS